MLNKIHIFSSICAIIYAITSYYFCYLQVKYHMKDILLSKWQCEMRYQILTTLSQKKKITLTSHLIFFLYNSRNNSNCSFKM